MSVQNLQSNAVRGEYLKQIMGKTIQEIHDDMVTVFGPAAMDAFITKDKQPYFTRDGKEVIQSLKFDNELAMYILTIMYQAVYNQAKAVGDGTTTVAVLYTNLYREIEHWSTEGFIHREEWESCVNYACDLIKKQAVPMNYELLKSVLYTCTQDGELSHKIYTNLKTAIMSNAYITINKSNIEDDFEMIVNKKPMIPATKQWSVRPIKAVEDHCIFFHCNGTLDITKPETLLDLMSHGAATDLGEFMYPYTYIIICNGTTDVTRKTLKEVVAKIQLIEETVDNFNINMYSNVAIYSLDNYRGYDSDQIEDISTIITDEPGIGGYVNALTFESLLHQALGNPDTKIPELETFDIDIRFIDKMKNSERTECKAVFDDQEGIQIDRKLGPVAQARYDELRKEIDEEKSEVRKITLQRRLKTMYGEFIEINVGSRLIKDSQRKYELILDAILSAGEGAKHGVLTANSLIIAAKVLLGCCRETAEFKEDADKHRIYDMLYTAVVDTLMDMIHNSDPNFIKLNDSTIEKINPYSFNLDRGDTVFLIGDETRDMEYTYGKVDGEDYVFPKTIVEPVTIITTMLENSTVMLDLAQARTFHLNSFMNNYL